MYVSKSLKVLTSKKKSYLNSGCCGSVYLVDEFTVLKQYFKSTNDALKLNDDVYSTIKEIDNDHLIKIYEAYTSIKHFLGYKKGKNSFIIDVYLAMRYNEVEKNILYDQKEYLLENLYSIENLMKILSNSAILAGDLSSSNTAFTESSMVLIDPDSFVHSTNTFEENEIENMKTFIEYIAFLFIDILEKDESINHVSRSELKKKIFLESVRLKSRFDFKNKSITDEFSKSLRFSKSPMEYFTKG